MAPPLSLLSGTRDLLPNALCPANTAHLSCCSPYRGICVPPSFVKEPSFQSFRRVQKVSSNVLSTDCRLDLCFSFLLLPFCHRNDKHPGLWLPPLDSENICMANDTATHMHRPHSARHTCSNLATTWGCRREDIAVGRNHTCPPPAQWASLPTCLPPSWLATTQKLSALLFAIALSKRLHGFALFAGMHTQIAQMPFLKVATDLLEVLQTYSVICFFEKKVSGWLVAESGGVGVWDKHICHGKKRNPEGCPGMSLWGFSNVPPAAHDNTLARGLQVFAAKIKAGQSKPR